MMETCCPATPKAKDAMHAGLEAGAVLVDLNCLFAAGDRCQQVALQESQSGHLGRVTAVKLRKLSAEPLRFAK